MQNKFGRTAPFEDIGINSGKGHISEQKQRILRYNKNGHKISVIILNTDSFTIDCCEY